MVGGPLYAEGILGKGSRRGRRGRDIVVQQVTVRVAGGWCGGGQEAARVEAYGRKCRLRRVLGVEGVASTRPGVVAVDAGLVGRGAREAGVVWGVLGIGAISAAAASAPLLHRDTTVARVARGNGGVRRVRRGPRRALVGVAVGRHVVAREDGVLVEVAAALVQVMWQRFARLEVVVSGRVNG